MSDTGWRPIATAPKEERTPIWIDGPNYRQPQAAWSDTFWTAGFSVENRPTQWKPRDPEQYEWPSKGPGRIVEPVP